VASHTPMTEIK
jgi:hypothetical protein